MLQYQNLPYIPKIIYFELISCHQNDLLARYFEIDKIQKLIAKKYYKLTFYHNIKIYIKDYNVSLTSKAVCHKLCKDL